MDVFDTKKRSEVMSKIKSTGAKSTEAILHQLLDQAGIAGWVEHDTKLPGKPDFAFLEARLAVFVDGCFWHGCPHCNDGHIPKSNTLYWNEKIKRNKRRDRRVSCALRKEGWSVIRIWECKLKSNPEHEYNRIRNKLCKAMIIDKQYPNSI